ncbi:hypothetical protein TWF970_000008 [Orbilia oligospora]|uniref:Uncharacterized protein n=1 Tax=Orbilia oligospora TaxID=2813651 RepID=A0A7C8RHI9_ORBOL|nr:hypothetical protein TWF970_000008 [Orbilia oligospora]
MAAAEEPLPLTQKETKASIGNRHSFATITCRCIDEVLTAKADIAITLLNCDETEPFRHSLNIKFGLSELPLPLKNMNQLPILTFEVKSVDGSSLETENQATMCKFYFAIMALPWNAISFSLF